VRSPALLILLFGFLLLGPQAAWASSDAEPPLVPLTGHWTGLAALAVFLAAYALVIAEEIHHLRKSVPMLLASGIIWALVGIGSGLAGRSHEAEAAVRHYLLEFGELFLFLLSAMTFINTMDDRGVFQAIRAWMVSRRLSLRSLFWITGGLAFFISPLADNLTTALLMGAIVAAVGHGHPSFLTVALINIVVAANAGGAYSPFGDITTLMVWQKEILPFWDFFRLFLPSLANWLVPAALLSTAVPRKIPRPAPTRFVMKRGALRVVALFLLTVAGAVLSHAVLGLPPVLGMVTGLGLLKLYGYLLSRRMDEGPVNEPGDVFATPPIEGERPPRVPSSGRLFQRLPARLDVFQIMEKAEWDTLMFFCGVILCVGGLGTAGYLELLSRHSYEALGPTLTNVAVGLLSAAVDNIPVMVAVLAMKPGMPEGQWLLVTLTAGVGGSLLSIGSAAGVALMGQARGVYTFMAHLRWSWAVGLGYAAGIWVHFWVNASLF
jgi:Na+/H+ antiporter NhaD/arsenite permease-like protein